MMANTTLVVKLGGACLTNKDSFETFDSDGIAACARHVSEAFAQRPVVVCHGAGSFGHFHATEYGLKTGGGWLEGGEAAQRARKGMVLCRASVRRLNHAVVTALHEAGLPAIEVDLFPFLKAKAREIVDCDWRPVDAAIAQGLLPVIHGDVFLDELHGCTIVGGDKLLRHLAEYAKPQLCAFITDVNGVYDKPPKSDEDARLLEELVVGVKGELLSTYSAGQPLPQDVTGGIADKVQAAAMVASSTCPVYVCGAGTPAASAAMVCDATRAVEGCTWVRAAHVGDKSLWPEVNASTTEFLQFMTNPPP